MMTGISEAHAEMVPKHVPPELVIDFDYYKPPGSEDDPHLAWKRLHSGPDIVYSPHYGGHWIFTRGEDMFAAMHDTGSFSSREFTVPKQAPGNPALLPQSKDPPDVQKYRSVLLPSLTPQAVAALTPSIRRTMGDVIDAFKPNGKCEFVSEFATRAPVDLFLEYVDCPASVRPQMRDWVEILARNPDQKAKLGARLGVSDYLRSVLAERRKTPRPDLFGRIVAAEEAGTVTAEEAPFLATNVFLGGLDTVAAALSFIIRYLAENSEHRRFLTENADRRAFALEELLRRFGVGCFGRIATRDVEFKGLTIRQGEQILLPLFLYGLDDRIFADPLKVDFNRFRAPHINFGTGVHRCVGSNLARLELTVFLDEWLARIPEFSLDSNAKAVGQSGVIMSMVNVPLIWDAAPQ